VVTWETARTNHLLRLAAADAAGIGLSVMIALDRIEREYDKQICPPNLTGTPVAKIDIVSITKKYKADLHEFFLDMESWKKFQPKPAISWKKVRFSDASQATIPKQRGIYAFTTEMSPGSLPSHGYILYVGITGDVSAATLHKRFWQYMRHKKKGTGRPAVVYFLQNWKDDLFFHYVAIPDKATSLAALEKSFITSIMPPANKRDIEGDVSKAKAAAF